MSDDDRSERLQAVWSRLRDPDCAHFGRIAATLRDRHRADLVCLIVGNAHHRGRGYASCPRTQADLRSGVEAFSVVRVTELRSNDLTLAHELGHNFGATHGAAHVRWADGYQTGTLMSRAPRVRLPVFSSGPAGRGNAATIRRNAAWIARYR